MKKSRKGNAPDSDAICAALCMVGASGAFAIMGGFVKLLHRLPVWEVVFFRVFINLVALSPWALSNKRLVATWRSEPKALLVRGVSGGFSAVCYFYAIEHLKLPSPASVASPIMMTTVLFSTLLGWWGWNELPDRWAFFGMLLIAAGLVGAFSFKPNPDPNLS